MVLQGSIQMEETDYHFKLSPQAQAKKCVELILTPVHPPCNGGDDDGLKLEGKGNVNPFK